MTVTDLFGKIFSWTCVVIGAVIGKSLWGINGLALGILAGYIGGSILFVLLLFLYNLLRDFWQGKT